MAIVHTKVSVIVDDPVASAAGQILPSDWNASHVIEDSSIVEAKLALTDITTYNVSDSAHGFAPKASLATGSPTTDQAARGPYTSTYAAGAAVTIMDLVYMGSSSKWLIADASAASTSGGMLAISLESKVDTQAMKVALPGAFVRNDAWNWTPGAILYVSETGAAITATQPTTTDAVIRVVGFAITADIIYFNPSSDYITHI
jgi:hypothetical protein